MPTDPLSTYRLQLHAGFTFDDAAAVLPYLAELGVTHVYCSPYLQAAPGSTHGYDVVDHGRVNEELGGEPARQRFVAALRAAGLGQVLDIVPNHMSVAVPQRNAWWWDVLRRGQASVYASYFDIDWSRGRLLVPVLGDDGVDALQLLVEDGAQLLGYHDHRFPVADGTGEGTAQEVHARQHYELANWRRGNAELGYRRFFDVTDLAAVRVEIPEVFEATHALPLAWIAAGELDGLRVDHPDGLADPTAYTETLAARTGGAWTVVEKILEPGERLPSSWPVAGTTGYDAMRAVDSLFVDPDGEEPLTRLYADLTGEPTDWAEVVHDLKLRAATVNLAAETRRVAGLLAAESGLDHDTAAAACAEYMTCLPVYRTYLRPGDCTAEDVATVRSTVAAARVRRPDLTAGLDAVAAGLLEPGEFAGRLQQTSGMVMAKGVEDTAYYRYHRLIALNEVGGDPGTFGTSLAEFHEYCSEQQRDWPATLTPLSTHDTKRSADVRHRLAVLSELPDQWAAAVHEWQAWATGPDANTDYLVLQTLVGAWPLPRDRAWKYVRKAVREAKQHTSWTDPDEAYEGAVRGFLHRCYDDPHLRESMAAFAARITPLGRTNALAAALVQLTMPGVPDTYQGSEVEDLSLVDPDNRRPVDYAARRRWLADIDAGDEPPLEARKLLVVSRALRLRRDRPDLLGPDASYDPVHADGPSSAHCVAFLRGGGALTIATRLAVGLARRGWRDTTLTLPPGEWQDALSASGPVSGQVGVADLLARLPVALLVRA